MDILCGRKMVHINPHGRESFIVYDEKSRVRSGIIKMMKSRRCVNKGCTTFLAHIIDMEKEKKTMTKIPVVCESPKVLLDNILGLPPKHHTI